MSDDLKGFVEMHMHKIKDAMVDECKVTFTDFFKGILSIFIQESEVAQRASREAVAEPRRGRKDGPRKQRKGAGKKKASKRKAGKSKAGERKAGARKASARKAVARKDGARNAGQRKQTRKVTKGNDCQYIL
jgi:hypothetical protein